MTNAAERPCYTRSCTGRSAVWLARLVWDQEVESSNLSAPIRFRAGKCGLFGPSRRLPGTTADPHAAVGLWRAVTRRAGQTRRRGSANASRASGRSEEFLPAPQPNPGRGPVRRGWRDKNHAVLRRERDRQRIDRVVNLAGQTIEEPLRRVGQAVADRPSRRTRQQPRGERIVSRLGERNHDRPALEQPLRRMVQGGDPMSFRTHRAAAFAPAVGRRAHARHTRSIVSNATKCAHKMSRRER